MKLLAIHGAFSSPFVFNYIISNFSEYKWETFSYQHEYKNIDTVIKRLKKYLSESKEDVIIIGHSLGGVIGANVLDHPKVKGLITLASPICGIRINFYASNFLLKRTFVQEISPYSKTIEICKKHLDEVDKPIYNFITVTGFSPFMTQENDGVVTLESQIHGSNKIIKIPANHHEVLQHPQTIIELNHVLTETYQKTF